MSVRILTGDCRAVLATLPAESVHCCVTSPPYFGLRDYGHAGQIGLEQAPDEFVAQMVAVFREVRRVLRDDGTLWLNLGDSYVANRGNTAEKPGHDNKAVHDSLAIRDWRIPGKPKDLIGIPWRVAFALQQDGWYLRQDIIWAKPNPMPESVRDRCTKSHEYIFLLSKSERYYYDADAIAEPVTREFWNEGVGPEYMTAKDGRNDGGKRKGAGPMDGTRNKRSVWTVTTKPFSGAHFATFPPDLIEPCVLAGCPPAGKRCDCDEVIGTPTGEGDIDDPSLTVGRAGMSRPRRPNEGTRPITRREQRGHAEQMRASPHLVAMRERCGPAFDHYIRTDRSGARPLPPDVLGEFMAQGWLTEPPPCSCPVEPAGTVLDPFGGAGTTGLVADRLQRDAILIELNPEYAAMARTRIAGDAPLFSEVA